MARVTFVGCTAAEGNAQTRPWSLPAGTRVGDTLLWIEAVYGSWGITSGAPPGTKVQEFSGQPDGLNTIRMAVYRRHLTAADLASPSGVTTWANTAYLSLTLLVYRKLVEQAVGPIPLQVLGNVGYGASTNNAGSITLPALPPNTELVYINHYGFFPSGFVFSPPGAGGMVDQYYGTMLFVSRGSWASTLAAGSIGGTATGAPAAHTWANMTLLLGIDVQPAYPDRVIPQGQLKKSRVYEEKAKRC